ncbi:unnamed protein product [Rhizoctonia solani]|uniref:Fungal-type protein kinase domain-containing protein n=1 Tax=Rhizoctonia solani TaxID=456999 RepID=A0A8H2X2Y1_9AGAM|nr:unnamed protein product [Rhizoctonia solani]
MASSARTFTKDLQTAKPAQPHKKRGYPDHILGTKRSASPISPPRIRATQSTPAGLGLAVTHTPYRRSTGSVPYPSSKLNQASHTHESHSTTTAAPKAAKQPEMEIQLELELRDTIFHDPKFVERFLSGPADKLEKIVERLHRRGYSTRSSNRNVSWSLPEHIPDEKVLYTPIKEILNKIKRQVDSVHDPLPSLAPVEHSTPQRFIDNHNNPIKSDLDNTSNIKPDLVLFQDTHRHWEDVRMPIEIKRLPEYHKAGIRQLSRYARAVFAHQLHRRHLYGMIVCGHEATFVRFDRAGVLYSGRINIVEQSETFTRAFASLLMLDRVDEGLDPAFTFKRNGQGRLVYYIDLPESELADLSAASEGSRSTLDGRTRRFEVIERLCHRQSVCGRATIVLYICEVPDTEWEGTVNDTGGEKASGRGNKKGGATKNKNKGKGKGKGKTNGKSKTTAVEPFKPREYVLKLIWRDPQRDSEGDMLEQARGTFGLAYHAGHWDVSMPGKCRCPTPAEGRCKNPGCVDRTVEVDELRVCNKLKDIDVSVPDNEEDEPEEVDTKDTCEASYPRQLRIYSCVLMLSIGIPLWRAESPRQLLTAVLDGMLGYWGLFNLGIMHRDISNGNVMMLSPEHTYKPKDLKRLANVPPVEELIESEKVLQKVLADLGRASTAFLSDFDLSARHSDLDEPTLTDGPAGSTRAWDTGDSSDEPQAKRRKDNSARSIPIQHKRRAIDYRRGTPAFMSVRVLKVSTGERYRHSFMDDLESFLWLIIWSVAAHLGDNQKGPTPAAQRILNKMNDDDPADICDWKTARLSDCCRQPRKMRESLSSFGNGWGSSSMCQTTIIELGCFFDQAMDETRDPQRENTPSSTIFAVVKILQDALKLTD